ncbi:MAG: nicotinate-nucleotide--dimethylbenzimidazole phosphoribosyltransferase [Chloroflexi bacterium]|nr:nicotinate-nucleotide--dimethylbenzimidazole phosphoribosyltransferase [Chloroflexota bacterium]
MTQDSLSAIIAAIGPLDRAAMARARTRQRQLTKPPGSLGRLEALSVQLAGIYGTERPQTGDKRVTVAAGDHGVVAQGVTAYPQTVTAQMVLNFLQGGAAVSVMARHVGVGLSIVDVGVATPLSSHPGLRVVAVGRSTGDITVGPAMTRAQAQRCLEEGAALALEVAQEGTGLVGTGDMGIGNTTPSSAIAACMTGAPPERTTGRGTGRTPEELGHKIAVVRRALEVNRPDPADALDVLAKVGGFEIGLLAGVILGTASARRAVVLDGFIAGAAALIACGLCPQARGYLIASHRSVERGHRVILRRLGLRPVLDLGLRLGEGTGAVLAMGVIEAAAACLSEMATFAEAGVTDRPAQSQEARP